jgi:hypothetical protein
MKSHMISQGFVGNLDVNLSHPPKLFAGLIPQADTVHDYWLLELLLDRAAGKLTKLSNNLGTLRKGIRYRQRSIP